MIIMTMMMTRMMIIIQVCIESRPWANHSSPLCGRTFRKTLTCHKSALLVVWGPTAFSKLHTDYEIRVESIGYRWTTIIYLQCDDLIKADLCNVTFPNFHPQIDLKERVQTALKSPPEGGCRELITILACSNILCKFLNDPNITKVSTEYLSYMIKFACCTLQEEVCLLSAVGLIA